MGRRQLIARGISAKAIDHRVAAGRLRVIHRGVYAVGHDAVQRRGLLVAGLLVAGPDAALSHRTAAALWRLLPSMPACVEISTTSKAPRQRPQLKFHEVRELDAYTRDDLRVTTPLRTLLDLAATRPRHEVERACSEALVLRLTSADALSSRHGPGSAVLKELAGAGVGPTRSELERRFLKAIPGLPQPLVNTRIGRHEIDFAWPHHRVVVELDGARFHDHHIAARRDRERDAELQLAGYLVLRFAWQEVVHDRPAVVARVAEALSRRARRRAT